MYELSNAGRRVSRHLTLDAAIKADMKLQRKAKKANGESSHVQTGIIHVFSACGREMRRSINQDQYAAAYARLGI